MLEGGGGFFGQADPPDLRDTHDLPLLRQELTSHPWGLGRSTRCSLGRLAFQYGHLDGEQGARQLRESAARSCREDGTPSVRRGSRFDSIHTKRAARRHSSRPRFLRGREDPSTSESTGVGPTAARICARRRASLTLTASPSGQHGSRSRCVKPRQGHGEVAGFEASVCLNRKDFGIASTCRGNGRNRRRDKITITLEIEALKR